MYFVLSYVANNCRREAEATSNPIQEEVFENLRETFKNEAVFFWNGLSGKEICISWRPSLLIPKKFAVLQSNYVIPMDDESPPTDSKKRRKIEGESQSLSTIARLDSSIPLAVPNVLEIVSNIVDSSEGMISNIVIN